MGHRAAFAENGREAIECLSKDRFDVILMDNRMPVMDGFEATRIIRDLQSPVLDHQVPVIALTANVSDAHREECFAAGMNDFLAKPIRETSLRAALARVLGVPDHDTGAARATAPALDATSSAEPVPSMTEEDLLAVFDEADAAPPSDPSAQLTPETRARVQQQFLRDTPKLLNLIRLAFASGDWEVIARAGHSLKSSSRYVRADRLSSVAREVETVGQHQDAARFAPLMRQCDCEFALLVDRLASSAS